MSEFSNLLSELIQSENINVASLTRYCGLDRSTMYKLINGKRSPASRELVQKIAEFIHLNPWERQRLMEAYNLTRLGPETYYQRRDILQFILNLNEFRKRPALPEDSVPEKFSGLRGDAVPLSGRLQVSAAVHSIFRQAAASDSSRNEIGILAQPELLKSLNLLPVLTGTGNNLKVQHIICLNSTPSAVPPRYNYNLQGLDGLAAFFGAGCQYQPFYYYDHLENHDSSFHLMSCLFFSEGGAVLCSTDLSDGYFFRSGEMTSPLRRHFQKLLSLARPLVLSFRSPQLPPLVSKSSDVFSLSYEPCLGSCLTPELLDKYLRRELPERESLLERLTAYLGTSVWTHNYFSGEGLEQFMKTGQIPELPAELFGPLEPGDRIRLLRQYAELQNSGLDIRMYGGYLNQYPPNFHLLSGSNLGYMLFIDPSGRCSCLILEEANLIRAFFDFSSSLAEMELLASAQETHGALQRVLDTFGG